MLEIVYQDDHFVAINKPNGLLVHRSPIASNTDTYAVQLLRDQIDQYVHPVHRLDRKTSGVLLFALDKDVLRNVQEQFANHQTKKTYWAILRGYSAQEGTIYYALTNEKGKSQEAITNYKTLETTEIDVPFGKHATSRYSLIEATPVTGRMHQLRKHFAHILHPIIGDRPHGCNKQNKLFLEKWQMGTMLLHAAKLELVHPISKKKLILEAKLSTEFSRMMKALEFEYQLPRPKDLPYKELP
ncbi:pseudouridine synthase [Roseivirga misakiensis]|uniref:tRNA pseudouridine synthase C n=1 Tax=Roseivirga misakiensis TaxID=1563681 RepID=A0A1E5T0J4_9BACT|nr:pseudouridine synthase [Roseivirga misakiensis]OEK04894.1 pseudouridylate synthase [Roseivirga misakiensis]